MNADDHSSDVSTPGVAEAINRYEIWQRQVELK